MRSLRVVFVLGLAMLASGAGCVMMPPDGGRGGAEARPAAVEYRCDVCGRHETATSAPTCHDQAMQPVGGGAGE